MGEMADFAADCMHEDEPLYDYGGRKQCRHCGEEFVWAQTTGGAWAPHEEVWMTGDDITFGKPSQLREHLPNCRVVGTSDLADLRRARP